MKALLTWTVQVVAILQNSWQPFQVQPHPGRYMWSRVAKYVLLLHTKILSTLDPASALCKRVSHTFLPRAGVPPASTMKLKQKNSLGRSFLF